MQVGLVDEKSGLVLLQRRTAEERHAIRPSQLLALLAEPISPGSETITRGVLAGFILELQSVNKFNGTVMLECSGRVGAICADLCKP